MGQHSGAACRKIAVWLAGFPERQRSGRRGLRQRLHHARLSECGFRGSQFGADRTPQPAPVPAFMVLGGDRVARGTEMIVVVDVGVALADRVPRMDLTHGLRYAFGGLLVVTPNTVFDLDYYRPTALPPYRPTALPPPRSTLRAAQYPHIP
jgi:hypothetical protein